MDYDGLNFNGDTYIRVDEMAAMSNLLSRHSHGDARFGLKNKCIGLMMITTMTVIELW